jgi:Tol biopolymer transport system component
MMAAGLLLLCSCQPASEEPLSPFPPATQIAAFGSLPRWSPDGQKLIFGADGAQMGIWLYDRSNGSLTQVTDADHPHLYDYRISNGNDKIAFGGAGAAIENTSGIWVAGLDGSDPVRWHTTGQTPCWMPNDTGLLFAENDPQSGTYGLFQILFADTSLTRLTDGGIDPQYNSAGSKIAYREAPPATTQYQLIVINPAGALLNILAEECAHFCWTENDNTIVFDFQSSSGAKICRVPAAGGTVSDMVLGAVEPSAASNGRVAYQSVYGDLSQGIRTTDITGADIQLISGEGFQPNYSPDGSAVAYASNSGIWKAEQ